MSELIKFETIDFPESRIIGKQALCGMTMQENPVLGLWDKSLSDGTFNILERMEDRILNAGHVDWMGNFNGRTKEFICIVGMLMKPGTSVPEGFVFRDLAPTRMAVAWVKGTNKYGGVHHDAGDITIAEIERRGLQYDWSKAYMMQVYDNDRFVKPLEAGEEFVVLDSYAPII